MNKEDKLKLGRLNKAKEVIEKEIEEIKKKEVLKDVALAVEKYVGKCYKFDNGKDKDNKTIWFYYLITGVAIDSCFYGHEFLADSIQVYADLRGRMVKICHDTHIVNLTFKDSIRIPKSELRSQVLRAQAKIKRFFK